MEKCSFITKNIWLIYFSEEIYLLLTKPEAEDGDYIPNFKPGKYLSLSGSYLGPVVQN